jgi:hypothetical protein
VVFPADPEVIDFPITPADPEVITPVDPENTITMVPANSDPEDINTIVPEPLPILCVDCAAPGPNCHYEGASCETCG